TPAGGSPTSESGKKINRSSGTTEHPASAMRPSNPILPAAEEQRAPRTRSVSRHRSSEVAARLLAARRLLLAALDPLPRDHVLVAHAGGDHRVDVRVLVDHHLEERSSGKRHELLEVAADLGNLRHPAREPEAVRLDRLHEVLLVEGLVRPRVAIGVE